MATVTASPIRTIRREKGLTAEQLAARAGLASATVYRAERGIGTPTDDTLNALAKVLGVDVAQFHDDDATGPRSDRKQAETTPAATASPAEESAVAAR